MNREATNPSEYFEWTPAEVPVLLGRIGEVVLAPFGDLMVQTSEGLHAGSPTYPIETLNNESTLERWHSLLQLAARTYSFFDLACDFHDTQSLATATTEEVAWGPTKAVYTINETMYLKRVFKRARLISALEKKLEASPEVGSVYRPTVLEAASAEVVRWLRKHPEDIDRMHSRSVEVIVGEVLASKGWSIELTKQTRDGGVDIFACKNDTLGFPVTMIVEVKKRTAATVGTPMVDSLLGNLSLHPRNATHAMFVTTSRFTRCVWKKFESRVGRDLILKEREELFEWLRALEPGRSVG